MTEQEIHLLTDMIQQGYVCFQQHPTENLFIYNYTNKAQYEKMWNDITLRCRGLIMDDKFNIIANPPPKFFNASELEWNLPSEPYRVFTKYDGSMLVSYWWNNNPWLATRGSFSSDQAILGTGLLNTKYKESIEKLDPSLTYVFELIHPKNRIVVDYGDTEELVLLSVRVTKTGEELELPDIGFPTAELHDLSLEEMKELDRENEEGFVVMFESGLRVKCKMAEYCRIHRIVTNCTSYDIWEMLKEGHGLGEILDRVPDEFMTFVQQTVENLHKEYNIIHREVVEDFSEMPAGDRKTKAEYIKTTRHPGILFGLLDHKDLESMIWPKLKPAFQKPFSNEYKNKSSASELPI